MFKKFIILGQIFYLATKRFLDERYSYRVSALAFTTLLSLIPILSIGIFLITIFPIFSDILEITEKYLLQNFLPSSALTLINYFKNFIQQASHLPAFSIIFLLITSILLIRTIDMTINDTWNVTKRRKHTAWIFYSFIIFLIPIFIGVSVFLTTYLFSFPLLSAFTMILVYFSPIFINTLFFSLIYILVPNTHVKISAGILSAFIAALMLDGGRLLFVVYIAHFSTYTLVYGVFSVVPIFLIWIYICWSIILWGALVSYELTTYHQA